MQQGIEYTPVSFFRERTFVALAFAQTWRLFSRSVPFLRGFICKVT